jgi:hypothetical protein
MSNSLRQGINHNLLPDSVGLFVRLTNPFAPNRLPHKGLYAKANVNERFSGII